MELAIKEYLDTKLIKYIEINHNISVVKIYNFLFKHIEYTCKNGIECYYKACYYEIHQKYEIMERYHKLSIIYGDDISYYKLGEYYEKIKRYDIMKDNYLKSRRDTNAIFRLSKYYFDIEKNSTLGWYYITEGIKFGNQKCINYNKLNNYVNLRDSLLFDIKSGNKKSVKILDKLCDNNILLFDKMILYLENKDILPRDKVIESINGISNLVMNKEQTEIFMDVMKGFNIGEGDKLNSVIRCLFD
jgi:hypothetical protein